MSSNAELVHRHGRGPVPPQQQQIGRQQSSSSSGGAAGGDGSLKTWHMWMLFGLGWPSVLLFFLSTIPSFGPKVQGFLITFGWLFCCCWWVSTAAGLLTDNMGKKQAVAFKANAIMAGIGSVIGGVFLVSYAVENWPVLYIAGFIAAVAAVFYVWSLDDASSSKAAADAPPASAAAAAAAGAGGQE